MFLKISRKSCHKICHSLQFFRRFVILKLYRDYGKGGFCGVCHPVGRGKGPHRCAAAEGRRPLPAGGAAFCRGGPGGAGELRDTWGGESPRRERLPVQKELLKALKDRAAG